MPKCNRPLNNQVSDYMRNSACPQNQSECVMTILQEIENTWWHGTLWWFNDGRCNVWFTHRLTTQIAITNTSFCVCKHRQLDLVRSCETEREEKKGQWSIQTSSDLLDSSLVDGRRFFKPSLSKLFVPGPNREMAPAGIWTQHWIIKSSN